jgi:hypothetical protein
MEEESLKIAHAKLFYRPIEAAVRWCGLVDFEAKILSEADHALRTTRKARPFQCIQQKLEILWDAIRHQELPYGHLGITAPTGTLIEPELLTIRHTDLKNWFTEFYTQEKPDFLFNESERALLPNHNHYLLKTLLIETEILKSQHTRNKENIVKLESELELARKKNVKLSIVVRQANKPSDRSERAYLRLIGSLINLLLGKTPSGKSYSSFTSQASIISALMANNRNKPGFTQRTLESKFSAAKRSIEDAE